jgi:hypothetical protein
MIGKDLRKIREGAGLSLAKVQRLPGVSNVIDERRPPLSQLCVPMAAAP